MSSILERADAPAHPGGRPDEDWNTFLANVVSRWSEEGGERKQDRSKRREREILRAALRVFARDGISRARIGDIAAEAGMPVSSIYEYFPSKEDLAYVLPITHLARFYREYGEAVADKTTARERLRLYLWLAADFARRNPEWARTLYLEIWPSVLVSESMVRHSINDYVRIIIFLIRLGETNGEWSAGPDPYETAAILNGSVNQVIITWLLYRKPRDLMKAVVSIIERTMTLLRPVAAEESKRARRRDRVTRQD
ncbi:transcriptional regulator, TetR family [Rhizobiales bacterium GAS191]|nr:transcriptional regulator, TetR family [Rhizobiales bacterium GAS188]SEF15615.1 transcriptional regulator, TetR family [Rhizobiales bacterium GAS191]